MAPYFQLSARADGQFMFRLLTDKGQVLLTSPPFGSKQAARLGIESVRSNARRAACYLRMVETETACYFVIVSDFGRVAATSGVFRSGAELESAVRLVMSKGATTVIKDTGAPIDPQEAPSQRQASVGGRQLNYR